MKISIIGAGWLGCHLAYKLKPEHEVKLYEKSEVFSGSSFYNQNRLHRGFHYSRSQTTRKLCYDTFDAFLNDYSQIVSDIKDNYYVIPRDESTVDFGTFKSIFQHENIPFLETALDTLSNIEGSILVDEKYIDPIKARNFFKSELKDVIVKQDICLQDFKKLSEESDLVVNVTNNLLYPIPNHYYEVSLTLVYNKLEDIHFGAITMVDGPLFSIYPYREGEYTVTDVQYTPLYTSESIGEVYAYINTLDNTTIYKIKGKIEEKIKYYYQDFNNHFKYKQYYTSIKVKKSTKSADRSPTIVKGGNIVTCVTGKIQGIYALENYIKNEIINR